MKNFYTQEESWLGGFYELALEFDEPKVELCERALDTLWKYPGLEGCYLDPALEPQQQTRIHPTWAALETHGHLRGIARLDGQEVACGCYAIKEDAGPVWLGFYIPMGTLETVFSHLTYSEARTWREPLDKMLASMGQVVFGRAPFSLGLIGFEVSGDAYANSLQKTGIPSQRLMGYLWPKQGELTYHPANQWGPSQLAAS